MVSFQSNPKKRETLGFEVKEEKTRSDLFLNSSLTYTYRYIVAFRSVRRKGADTALLYQADREAHEEAVTAGGLLLYW